MKKILVGFLCVAALMAVAALPACTNKAADISNQTEAAVQTSPVVQSTPNAAKSGETSSSAEIPNALVKYDTLDEARKAAEFNFGIPATLPDGYQMKDIVVIHNDLAEILYLKGDNRILYRTAKGDSDISGDYNDYANVNAITVENFKATVKGNGDSISLVTWSKDGVSFSLSFDDPVNQASLSTIIESIQ